MKTLIKKYSRSVLYCILVLSVWDSIRSQTLFPLKQFSINNDYNRFWKNDSTAYLEIAFSLSPQGLTLQKDSLGYAGKIATQVLIQHGASGEQAYNDQISLPVHIADSSGVSKSKSLVFNRTYLLGTGTYSVAILSYDSFNHSRQDSAFFSVEITLRPDTVVISDIELSTSITESADRTDPLYKNSYRVVPNPSCIYGMTTSPVVFTYKEIYNVHSGRLYIIQERIIDGSGSIVKSRKSIRRYSVRHAVEAATMNVAAINSGKYIYEAVVSDTLDRVLAKSNRPIYIYNPALQSGSKSILTPRGSEFAGMSMSGLAEEFRTAEYLARPEEIQAFSSLATIEACREFMANFWERIEKSEEWRSILSRPVYLRRVQFANERYKSSFKEGWRTSQGRVYVLHGEPDEIQRFPNSMNTKAYEIWNYHRIENGVQFVFIDFSGFHEYILVHSTKRGEVSDENWDKLLERSSRGESVN